MKEKILFNGVEIYVEISGTDLYITDKDDVPIAFTPEKYEEVMNLIKNKHKTAKKDFEYKIDVGVKPLNVDELR